MGKNAVGFTILELIVVMSIIGIIAVFAVSGFSIMGPGIRLSGASRLLYGDLMNARMESIKQNNKYKISFKNESYTIHDDDDCDNRQDAGEFIQTVNIKSIYKDVSLSSNRNIIFTPRGTASSFGTITLQNSSGSRKLSVNITGRVKIKYE